MNGVTASELNILAEKLGVVSRAVFYDGDPIGVINSVAPYGKIAVIYSKTTYTERGKDFSEKLKAAGLKPLGFIMPENATLNFESVFNFIGVPEDVRAVVYFDSELKDITAYIATIFNVPVIYALSSVYTEGVLSAKVPFFWKNSADFFSVTCPYHVVLPETVAATDAELAEQYVNIVDKSVALCDYRVKLKILGGTKKVAVYNLIEEATKEILPLPSVTAEQLLLSGLKIEIANLASNGAIIYNSAEYCFKRITGFKAQEGLNFAFIKKFAELCELCASGQEDPFTVPDYNNRARELATVTASDDGAFLKGLLNQLQRLRKQEDLKKIKTAFKKEFTAIVAALKDAEKVYKSLGGKDLKDFSPYLKAFKLCGDLPATCNFMTLVRESGFTEDI